MVDKKHIQVASLLLTIAVVINIVGGSSKCYDMLHQWQSAKIIEALDNDKISSGKSLK